MNARNLSFLDKETFLRFPKMAEYAQNLEFCYEDFLLGIFFFKFLSLFIFVLVSVAFLTLMERKIIRIVGFRLGPTKVSFYGLLQPIGDAVKLANKSCPILMRFSRFIYFLRSFLILFFSLYIWSCISISPSIISFKFSLIMVMIVLGFNTLNSILCGWSSHNKYGLLGSLRSVRQLISYEAALYLCFFFFTLLLFRFELDFLSFYNIDWIFFFLGLVFYVWLPSILAELNRTPYDFSEGERELVRGFNTEFGSFAFTFIFLAEYSIIIFFSLLSSFLYFYSYSLFVFFFFYFFVIWVRCVLPRYRFDKLIMLAWKFFIPFLTFLFCWFIITVL